MVRLRIKSRPMAVGVLMCAAIARSQTHTQAAAPAQALDKLGDALLEWPLRPGQETYAAIDGRHLHPYVVEQAAISRRYRDQGHPKFWGRIKCQGRW